jgi:hypothetical protein
MSLLPTDHAERKATPVTTGVLDYFPRAIAYVAKVSKVGNDKHNPGEPLHWARGKSTDQADCIGRHLIERGTFDDEGMRHSGMLAWRALALLETELELAEGIDAVAQAKASKQSRLQDAVDSLHRCGIPY